MSERNEENMDDLQKHIVNGDNISNEEEDDNAFRLMNGGGQDNKDDVSLFRAYEENVRPFIDLIDRLRALGLDQIVNLPSVVVIGDQSSGKSSVLEAISGVQLPRGSGIVTRCPLELQLKSSRRENYWAANISYQLKDHNGKSDKSKTEKTIDKPEDVEEEVLKAQEELTGGRRDVTDDLITLSVEAWKVPDLTLIDLPGIVRVNVKGQAEDICMKISRLIRSYIEREETIVLAVVPANVDIATTEALRLAKEVDPNGNRTLGVVTKPDLIDKGAEEELLSILNNERHPLRKGYIVVKCRGQNAIKQRQLLTEAITEEEQFFRKHPVISTVDQCKCGTKNLSETLSLELVEQIKNTLPALKAEVSNKLEATRNDLLSMGEGIPTEISAKRIFTLKLINKFNDLVREATYGDYQSQDMHYEFRLNTTTRGSFEKLAKTIQVKGARYFEDKGLIAQVTDEIKRSRGRELPGFLKYPVCEQIIRKLLKTFEQPVAKCVKDVADETWRVFEGLCEKMFAKYPTANRQLKAYIHSLCVENRLKCQSDTEVILWKENVIFTQDDTFVSNMDILKKELEKESDEKAEQKAVPFQNVYVQVGQVVKDIFKDAVEVEAEELLKKVQIYMEIASKRVMDCVPMTITYFMRQLVDEIRIEAQKFGSDSETIDLFVEEQIAYSRRYKLQEKLFKLEKAEDQLIRI